MTCLYHSSLGLFQASLELRPSKVDCKIPRQPSLCATHPFRTASVNEKDTEAYYSDIIAPETVASERAHAVLCEALLEFGDWRRQRDVRHFVP
jgi:hypothetical protein